MTLTPATKKKLLEIAKSKCTLPFRGFVLVKPDGAIVGQTLASSKAEVRTQAVKEFRGFSAWNAAKKKGWRIEHIEIVRAKPLEAV